MSNWDFEREFRKNFQGFSEQLTKCTNWKILVFTLNKVHSECNWPQKNFLVYPIKLKVYVQLT